MQRGAAPGAGGGAPGAGAAGGPGAAGSWRLSWTTRPRQDAATSACCATESVSAERSLGVLSIHAPANRAGALRVRPRRQWSGTKQALCADAYTGRPLGERRQKQIVGRGGARSNGRPRADVAAERDAGDVVEKPVNGHVAQRRGAQAHQDERHGEFPRPPAPTRLPSWGRVAALSERQAWSCHANEAGRQPGRGQLLSGLVRCGGSGKRTEKCETRSLTKGIIAGVIAADTRRQGGWCSGT